MYILISYMTVNVGELCQRRRKDSKRERYRSTDKCRKYHEHRETRIFSEKQKLKKKLQLTMRKSQLKFRRHVRIEDLENLTPTELIESNKNTKYGM